MQRQIAFLTLTLLASATLSGCADDGGDGDGEVASGVADVIYLDETTDEALLSLLDRAAIDDAAHRVSFDVPAEGEVLPSAIRPAFTFQSAPVASARPRAPWRRAVSALGAFLNPIGVAHAHGDPYNGTAHFLVFSTESDPELLRVFTAATTYTPDTVAWSRLSEASGPITLGVTSATFENNLLVEGGGPFDAGSVRFSIE